MRRLLSGAQLIYFRGDARRHLKSVEFMKVCYLFIDHKTGDVVVRDHDMKDRGIPVFFFYFSHAFRRERDDMIVYDGEHGARVTFNRERNGLIVMRGDSGRCMSLDDQRLLNDTLGEQTEEKT